MALTCYVRWNQLFVSADTPRAAGPNEARLLIRQGEVTGLGGGGQKKELDEEVMGVVVWILAWREMGYLYTFRWWREGETSSSESSPVFLCLPLDVFVFCFSQFVSFCPVLTSTGTKNKQEQYGDEQICGKSSGFNLVLLLPHTN